LTFTVTLRKKYGGLGKAREGTLFVATFDREVPCEEAVARAYRMLRRDHPFENPMAWDVVEPEVPA
jgi:hypothetical protein